VTYVEVDGGQGCTVLRRSDGQVVVCGAVAYEEDNVPPLDPGTSYVQISSGDLLIAARVGPTSTYVSYVTG
jgi:hypothetical protein